MVPEIASLEQVRMQIAYASDQTPYIWELYSLDLRWLGLHRNRYHWSFLVSLIGAAVWMSWTLYRGRNLPMMMAEGAGAFFLLFILVGSFFHAAYQKKMTKNRDTVNALIHNNPDYLQAFNLIQSIYSSVRY